MTAPARITPATANGRSCAGRGTRNPNLPSPTIDFSIADGVAEIPIEQRGAEEVATMTGRTADGRIETVRIAPDGSPVANYAFDVTPARLITGLITERGICEADEQSICSMFPDHAA